MSTQVTKREDNVIYINFDQDDGLMWLTLPSACDSWCVDESLKLISHKDMFACIYNSEVQDPNEW